MMDMGRLVGGEAVLVPIGSSGERISVNIIGFCQNKTLMVSLKDKAIRISDLALNSVYQFRANNKNVVYTFTTEIKKTRYQSVVYFYLSTPEAKRKNKERKFPRISLAKQKMTLSINTGQGKVNALLADISLDGAQLVAKQRLARVDESFCIDMLIKTAAEMISLPCKVRYVRTDIQTQGQSGIVFHHGVEFNALSENATQFLELFAGVSES